MRLLVLGRCARRCGVVATVLSVGAFLSCTSASAPDPRMITEWTRTLYGAVRVERLSPPVASRLISYATAALYAGLASSDPRAPSLSSAVNEFPELPRPAASDADPTLVAVTAERVVLDSLFREALPTTRSNIARLADSLISARVQRGVRESVRVASVELGAKTARAILNWSNADRFAGTRGRAYVAPVGPGLWANDAPASTYASTNMSAATEFVALDNPANLVKGGKVGDRALVLSRPKRPGLATLPPVNISGASEPYWSELRPFVLSSWSACAIADPPAYSLDSTSARYRDALEVRETQRRLTPAQRTIALFWVGSPGTELEFAL